MKFDFASARKTSEKEYGLESGGPFKPSEGANKLRLLSAPLLYVNTFKGKQRAQYVCWVYDYREERVRLYFMPPSIYKMIEGLQKSEEYGFEEIPMPYDISLNADGAGTIEVKYQVMASRTNTELTTSCIEQLDKKGPIEDVVAKLKEKEAQDPFRVTPQAPVAVADQNEVKLEDIPF